MSADKIQYGAVDTAPVKSFFVDMLIRDIALEDAILDLLDNCVDGVLRSKDGHKPSSKPYDGFYADIKFDKSGFSITDNCGGIPWDLHEYAFRMGRPKDRKDAVPGSVGVYGIGMKRAIFKMGRHCLISTKNKKSAYDVEITPNWMKSEDNWMISAVPSKQAFGEDGTTIVLGVLNEGVSMKFDDDSNFESGLRTRIATHYAFIIEKGFCVKVNGHEIKASPTKLLFAGMNESHSFKGIRPYIYEDVIDGVSIFLAVGFTRPLPTQNEVEKGVDEGRYSTIGAGWTVLCNDRAVLYCDKTEVTGWGDNTPRYHTQFIAISGIVEFKADDAKKLPTTTTKRGIDASSKIYLRVRTKMREGLKLFTDYTNKWKGREDESKKQMEAAGLPVSFDTIKSTVKKGKIRLNSTKGTSAAGWQYKPNLPLPREVSRKRIGFLVSEEDFEKVSTYLFKRPDAEPSKVGEKCFEFALREASK